MILSVPDLVALAKNTVTCVSAKQAYQNPAATFIDVREPAEVSSSPVHGSINIPRGVLEMNISKYCKTADSDIYIHCASGGRAALAAEQLQRIGYTSVKAISCMHENVSIAQRNQ